MTVMKINIKNINANASDLKSDLLRMFNEDDISVIKDTFFISVKCIGDNLINAQRMIYELRENYLKDGKTILVLTKG
jgi:hypothetical protein